MTNNVEDFLKEKEVPEIDLYGWETEEELATNTDTMNDWLEHHCPEEYTVLEDTFDGTYIEIIDDRGYRFECHASGAGDFRSHKIEFKFMQDENQQPKQINERPPFAKETIISRDSSGWTLPAGMTKEAGILLRDVVDNYGDLIDIDEQITTKDLATRLEMQSEEVEDSDSMLMYANSLRFVEHMTYVIFDGDHRNPDKVEYQYSAIGTDLEDAEKFLDELSDNENKKSKYKDGKERRISMFVGQGGELKSGVMINEKPSKSSKLKNN